MSEANGNNVKMAALTFVLSVALAIAGALAYLHATFVTYREFTAALEALQRQ